MHDGVYYRNITIIVSSKCSPIINNYKLVLRHVLPESNELLDVMPASDSALG